MHINKGFWCRPQASPPLLPVWVAHSKDLEWSCLCHCSTKSYHHQSYVHQPKFCASNDWLQTFQTLWSSTAWVLLATPGKIFVQRLQIAHWVQFVKSAYFWPKKVPHVVMRLVGACKRWHGNRFLGRGTCSRWGNPTPSSLCNRKKNKYRVPILFDGCQKGRKILLCSWMTHL